MTAGQDMRRRSKKHKKHDAQQPTETKEDKKKSDNKKSKQEEEPKTPPTTFRGKIYKFMIDFPMISAGLTMWIPMLLYELYIKTCLQYGLPGLLRPPISERDMRQVLIIGPMGSGTSQAAKELSRLLEISHESADASSHFCRDGTVSWFHGIRFFESIDNYNALWKTLCTDHIPNMGFHPKMYQREGNSNCTSFFFKRPSWNNCWRKQCMTILHEEWGCNDSCRTPFKYVLHQVRHPLRNMESLMVKFCQGSSWDNTTTHPSFVTMVSALWSNRDFTNESCLEMTAWYVTLFHQSMMKNDIPRFQIENASPCRVAKHMAGLNDIATTIYPPNVERVEKYCKERDDEFFDQTINRRNTNDTIKLTWNDLIGGKFESQRDEKNTEIRDMVQALTKELGYSIVEDEETEEF